MDNNKTACIILAAGRGSRMGDLTAEQPKCLLYLAGRPLLHWQLDALNNAGIEQKLVVRGYAAHCLTGDFETVDNPDWANTNMLSSLLCANDFAQKFFDTGGQRLLVSYSDIVWHPDHAKKLIETSAHIAITYDRLWEKLWRLRFSDPLSDAETFIEKDGKLHEIGAKTTDPARIQGQYMGLLTFDEAGWQTLLDCANELGDKTAKTDMTTFLRFLLDKGAEIGAVPVSGGWCEADSESDIKNYEKALKNGFWNHDWR